MKAGLRSAVQAVAHALADPPAPGMLIDGIGGIARGVRRLTRDVDATVPGDALELQALVDRLRRHDLTPRIDDAVAFARANQVLLLRHVPSGIDVDVSLAWLPFELEALAAAELIDIGGVAVRVARAEPGRLQGGRIPATGSTGHRASAHAARPANGSGARSTDCQRVR